MEFVMHINLKQLRDGSAKLLPFEFSEDISELEETMAEPMSVTGEVLSRAGVLFLNMEIKGKRKLSCDRCAAEYERVSEARFESVIVQERENEEAFDEDDLIVCPGDELDLSELAIPAFILSFESKNLCKEDCKGLCQMCGANLNEESCGCKTEQIDPRLEILAQLLDD